VALMLLAVALDTHGGPFLRPTSRLYMASPAPGSRPRLLAVAKAGTSSSPKKFNDLFGRGLKTIGGLQHGFGPSGKRVDQKRKSKKSAFTWNDGKSKARSDEAGERRCAQDVNLKSRKGFSLVEILIAVVILFHSEHRGPWGSFFAFTEATSSSLPT